MNYVEIPIGLIDGKLSVSRKENIEGEHTFDMKIDSIKSDDKGNLVGFYLKLTESRSRFQIKITFSKRGVNFLSKFFVEEFTKQFSKEVEEKKNDE